MINFRTVAKAVLPVIFVLSVCLVKAETASYDDVQKVVRNFMKRSFGRVDSIVEVVKFDTLDITTMYAFNFEKGGYVLVSGSYNADPILAYSNSDKFLPKDSIDNEGLLEFLGDCNAEIVYREGEKLRSANDDFSARKWNDWKKNRFVTINDPDVVMEVSDLLYDSIVGASVKWQQAGCPGESNVTEIWSNTVIRRTNNPLGISYNIMMPSVAGCAHAVAGCVPTALAQVMRKWRWPESVSYVYNGETYTSEYTWDSMPARLSVSSSIRNMNEISTLLRDCGYMLNAEYSCGGTPANDERIYEWLVKKDMIGYGAYRNIYTDEYNKEFYRNASDSYPMTEWLDIITTELVAKRPVIVSSVQKMSEDKRVYGNAHCFIISGFQRRDDGYYYYVNFGWGGKSDGYYNVNFTTNSYIKTKIQTALIGFSPKKENENHEHDIKATCVKSTIGNEGHLSFNVENANSYILKIKYMKKEISGWGSRIENGVRLRVCHYGDELKEVILERKSGNIDKNGEVEVWTGDNIKLENEYSTDCDVFSAPTMYEISFMNNYGQVETIEVFFSDGDKTNDESILADEEISIYPNPTTGIFSIDSYKEKIVSISISDVSGKTIKSVDQKESNHYNLDLSESPVGCYFVYVLTENSSIVKKLIKK